MPRSANVRTPPAGLHLRARPSSWSGALYCLPVALVFTEFLCCCLLIENLPHLRGQGRRTERLLQKGYLGLQDTVVHDRVVGVAGQK
jgi:hypothetical protein